MAQRRDRVQDPWLDREVEASRERDGAQHPDRIFTEADLGIADRSHQPRAQIFEPVDVVDDRERRDVVEDRVDREIAAERVFFRRAERVVVMQRFRVARGRRGSVGGRRGRCGDDFLRDLFARLHLAAERRHFDHLRSELDVRETEPATDDPAVAKEFLDLVGMRRGADVEILGPASEQQVADAASDQVSDVLTLPKPIHTSARPDRRPGAKAVGIAGNDPRFDHGAACTKGLGDRD